MWEFRSFALKGNVVDLSVDVISAAFGRIVDSLVKGVIMPVISGPSAVSMSATGSSCCGSRRRVTPAR